LICNLRGVIEMEGRSPRPGEVVRGWLGSISTRLRVAARVSGLRFQINQLLTRRRETLREIGEKVFQLYKRDKVGNPDILELCKRLEEIEEEIAQKEREIERIRAEAGLGEEREEVEVSEEPLEKGEG